MTNPDTIIGKHTVSMKQHLAGVAGARAWINDLMAAHLLHDQSPIRDEPLPAATEVKP